MTARRVAVSAPCPDCGGAVEAIDHRSVVCENWPGCPFFDDARRHELRSALADLRATMAGAPPWSWMLTLAERIDERMRRWITR